MQLLAGGLANGSVYGLIAIGFVIIFKSSSILNFSQGELMMVGAYLAFVIIMEWQVNFYLGVLIALSIAGIFGLLLNAFIFQRMINEPVFSSIMITVGLASLLRSVTGIVFKLEESSIVSPVGDAVVNIGGIAIWQIHLLTIAVAILLFGIFFVFFKYTSLGIGMRAAAEDQGVAQLMGVSIKIVFGLSWAIAAIVAAIGGIFMAQLSAVTPEMYLIGLRALPAAFLGGIDSIPGAIIGGLIIGIIESFAGGYISGGAKEVVAFIMLFIILLVRPYGLFGTREIKRV